MVLTEKAILTFKKTGLISKDIFFEKFIFDLEKALFLLIIQKTFLVFFFRYKYNLHIHFAFWVSQYKGKYSLHLRKVLNQDC